MQWSQQQAWPKEVKKFFATALRRLPNLQQVIDDGLTGYFYAASFGPDNAGVTAAYCQIKSQKAHVIVFNGEQISAFLDLVPVASRPKMFVAGNSPTALFSLPDDLLVTLFHETAHFIDFKMNYADDGSPRPNAARGKLRALSWTSETENKFDAAGSSLVSTTGFPDVCAYAPARAGLDTPPGFALFNDPSLTEERIRFLATKTNFFDVYSMTNAHEDFAETLGLYFLASRYHQTSRYAALNKPVTTKSLKGVTKTYEVDDLDLMRNSPLHRDKVCQLAKLVWQEDCKAALADAVSPTIDELIQGD